MAIHVRTSPVVLQWSDFSEVASLAEKEDAHTRIGFDVENKNFIRNTNRQWILDDITLTVTPLAEVLQSADKTATLLSHEQGHYNIGILVGRAMALELEGLAERDPHELARKISTVYDKHRLKLMGPIQKVYDKESDHSVNTDGQAKWDKMISDALGQSTPVRTLNALPL